MPRIKADSKKKPSTKKIYSVSDEDKKLLSDLCDKLEQAREVLNSALNEHIKVNKIK